MHGHLFSIGYKLWVILTLYSSDTLKTYSTLSYSPLPCPDVSPADARLGAGANKTGACYSNCFMAKLTRKQRAAAVLHHSPSGPHICFKCTGLFPPLCNITPQPCNWQLHIFSLAQVMAIAARAAALRFPVRRSWEPWSVSTDVLFVMWMFLWKHPSGRLWGFKRERKGLSSEKFLNYTKQDSLPPDCTQMLVLSALLCCVVTVFSTALYLAWYNVLAARMWLIWFSSCRSRSAWIWEGCLSRNAQITNATNLQWVFICYALIYRIWYQTHI